MAVAVFQTSSIEGEVLFSSKRGGVEVRVSFSKLPPGDHGFHIHKAGDLRGEGCKGLCEHFDLTGSKHGDGPHSKAPRHTGDLGNITGPTFSKTYFLRTLALSELYGRSVIVHADPDDLGLGLEEDSQTTGHSGKRIGCAIIGRRMCFDTSKTRKRRS